MGADHLRRILEEAQAIVNDALRRGLAGKAWVKTMIELKNSFEVAQ